MPLYVHPINLYVKKDAIQSNYLGGIDQFLVDLNVAGTNLYEIDNELIGIRSMDVQDFDFAQLERQGFAMVSGEDGIYHAEDFVIYNRHFNQLSWECDWLEHNRVFAWHIDAKPTEIEEAKSRGNCPMNEIEKRYGWEEFSKPIVH
jgi:hypothetical protein